MWNEPGGPIFTLTSATHLKYAVPFNNQNNDMLFVLLIRNMNCVITHFHVNEKLSGMWQIYPRSTWWRHQMETLSALQAICAGNSPVPGEFPAQRPVTRNFDVFFDLRPNKLLSKQSWGWWFETPSLPLWRHCNERPIYNGTHHVSEDYWPTNWQTVSLESAQRTRDAIIASLLRFGVTITLLLRRVSTGPLNEFGNCLYAP